MNAVRSTRSAGARILLASLLLTVFALDGRAAAATDIQIGTFNMAGGHKDHGPKGDEAPDALVASIQDREPAFVTLQEACEDWVQRVDEQLPEYSVAFDGVQLGNGNMAECKHPSPFGNAIVYRNDLGIDTAPVAYDLGSPEGRERRELLCVASDSRNLVVCSTHLTSGGGDADVAAREAESDNAVQILLDAYAGKTMFVGGDLNAEPDDDALDRFYHAEYGDGATGFLKEVDSPCGDDIAESVRSGLTQVACRNGESTHDDFLFMEEGPSGAKLDYLFVSPWVKVRSGDATFGIHSDHDPVWADVTF